LDITDPLQIDVQHEDAASVRVLVRGDLDLATAGLFEHCVAEACGSNPHDLWIDFTDLNFCDSSGIRACIAAVLACRTSGTHMRIVGAQPNIRRVFHAAGIGDKFEWSP